MKSYRILLILPLYMSLSGCFVSPGSSANNPRSILDESEAREIFYEIDAFFSSVEYDLPEGLIDMSFPGDAGIANATGENRVTNSGSSYSSYSSQIIDIFVEFDEFTPEGSTMIISGIVRLFNYDSYRTACSGSFCSSSSDHSRGIETRPTLNSDLDYIEVTIQLQDEEWVSERMTIDAYSPEYTYSWNSIEVDIEGGERYSL